MKPLHYIASKDEKGWHWPNRKVMEAELASLPPGRYDYTIEKHKKKASLKQFGWLFGLIYPQSLILLNQAGYEMTTIEECDLFWKSLFASKEVLIRETGEIRLIPLSKREFLTIDHMAYCSNIRNYCEEYLGGYIDDPDPDWKQRKAEIQAEIEKEVQRKINANEL